MLRRISESNRRGLCGVWRAAYLDRSSCSVRRAGRWFKCPFLNELGAKWHRLGENSSEHGRFSRSRFLSAGKTAWIRNCHAGPDSLLSRNRLYARRLRRIRSQNVARSLRRCVSTSSSTSTSTSCSPCTTMFRKPLMSRSAGTSSGDSRPASDNPMPDSVLDGLCQRSTATSMSLRACPSPRARLPKSQAHGGWKLSSKSASRTRTASVSASIAAVQAARAESLHRERRVQRRR